MAKFQTILLVLLVAFSSQSWGIAHNCGSTLVPKGAPTPGDKVYRVWGAAAPTTLFGTAEAQTRVIGIIQRRTDPAGFTGIPGAVQGAPAWTTPRADLFRHGLINPEQKVIKIAILKKGVTHWRCLPVGSWQTLGDSPLG